MRTTLATVLISVLLLGVTPRSAGGQPRPAVRYQLESASSFAHGCTELCDCTLVTSKLGGSFTLQHLNDDPLFSYYAVQNLSLVVFEPTGPRTITGAGTYQVGGEVALQERMILDLTIEGLPMRQYDSGLVAGGGDFPRITIVVRRHEPPVCTDTLVTIVASPGNVGVDPREARWPRLSPNPFGTRLEVGFDLAVGGPVDVAVLDLTGRRVRWLARGISLGPGLQSLSWDGLDESGAPVPAGVYRVRVQLEGRTVERTVAKLR